MTLSDFTPVLHTVGFLASIAIYGMLVFMVWRVGLSAATRVPLAVGVLGLFWNVGSLFMFGMPEFGFPEPPQIVDAFAYAALGFLPAVVVHSVLRDHPGKAARGLTLGAYLMSSIAGVGHFVNLVVRGFAPLPLAQHSIGWAFGIVAVVMLFLTSSQAAFRRALWMIALALFAVTGSEIAYHSGGSLLPHMVGHHASMLLALVILYHEYRFALADRFLKRALTLIALLGVALGSYVLVLPRVTRDPAPLTDPRLVGVVVTLWLSTAIVYPRLRGAIDRVVDHWVLRRDIHGRVRSEIARLLESAETSAEVTTAIWSRIAAELGASEMHHGTAEEIGVEEADESGIAEALVDSVRVFPRGSGAVVVFPTAETPRYACRFGELSEGRRLTAEDVALLEWTASRAARRIDRLRLLHERYEHELKKQEMLKLATEAELRALRAQINPHFLFNALTTIGHLIREAPDRALDTLLNLTELLRRVLRSSEDLTTLGEELDLVVAYLDIERARFEERLETSMDVPVALRTQRVPTLILQPIVENAIKHGIAPLRTGGHILIRARADTEASRLYLTVKDTGAGATPEASERGRSRGVGLRNVEERLRARYGRQASLTMESTPDVGTEVILMIPIIATGALTAAAS